MTAYRAITPINYLAEQTLRHLGIISVFLVVVVPSLERTLANFSNDITATRLVWNSGMKRLKSILSPYIGIKNYYYQPINITNLTCMLKFNGKVSGKNSSKGKSKDICKKWAHNAIWVFSNRWPELLQSTQLYWLAKVRISQCFKVKPNLHV